MRLKKLFGRYTLLVFSLLSIISQPVLAVGSGFDETFYYGNDILFYDPRASNNVCGAQSQTIATSNVSGTGSNKDYAGRAILTDAQLKAVDENKKFYEAGASAEGVPWQMIAVIHLRETGLKRTYPGNGDGPYQILGSGLPQSGFISDDTFQGLTNKAAKFIKSKSSHPDKLSVGDIEEVKDTFFGYNGRAPVYATQAKTLGFGDKAYEGSPYVMNKADEKRDPDKNSRWGQIKTDGGGLSYPANSDYGAFVVYGALAGIPSSGGCNSALTGPVAQKVVTLLEQELKLWESSSLKPGTDFHKYTDGRTEAWCADFASWIYSQAGYPFYDGEKSSESYVPTMVAEAKKSTNTKWEWHPTGDGYTPKPGDLHVVNGQSHVSVVVAVNGDNVTNIGGNQSGSGGPTTTKVSKDNWVGSGTVGYITPKGSQ